MALGLLWLIAAPNGLVPDLSAAADSAWRLEGTGALIEGEDPLLEVRGTGDDSSAWLADIRLEPAGLYQLTFDIRGTGSGGCAVAGLTSVNHDIAPTDLWQTYQRMIRVPDAPVGGAPDVAGSGPPAAGAVTLRFGQWHWNGVVQFRRIRLAPVRAVHAGPAGLGEGERITDGEYSFVTNYGAQGASYSRLLEECRASFNTDRFGLDDTAEVVYRVRVPEAAQTSATLEAQVGYHVSGGLLVEACASGEEWVPVGRLVGVGGLTVDLPPEPAALRFRVALDPQSWEWGGDGVTFVVTAQGGGEPAQELYRRHLGRDAAGRGWHAAEVSLAEWAGRAVTITLSTEAGPAGDGTADWAGWDSPRIVRIVNTNGQE